MPAHRVLTDEDMAAIVEAHQEVTAAALAQSLGRPLAAVAAALARVRKQGWASPLVYRPCTECGELVSAGPYRRIRCHEACRKARTNRLGRELRQRDPIRAAGYMARYYERHPEAVDKRRARQRDFHRRRNQQPLTLVLPRRMAAWLRREAKTNGTTSEATVLHILRAEMRRAKRSQASTLPRERATSDEPGGTEEEQVP